MVKSLNKNRQRKKFVTEFNIPALQIEHISKSFNAGKNPKKALSDVRFSIEQGDFSACSALTEPEKAL